MREDQRDFVKTYRLGILGFGNVARAFVEHYQALQETIAQVYGFTLQLMFVCDSQSIIQTNNIPVPDLLMQKSEKGYVGKPYDRPLEECKHWLDREECDIILDVLPSSKNNAGPSFPLLKRALKHGIHIISANKAPLVFGGAELLDCARAHKATIGVSGATAGCLPTSGVLTRELAGSDVLKIRGILNGTSNYVLDCVMYESLSLETAVAQAVDMGIAEPDATFDLDGTDTCFKMIILALLMTGKTIPLEKVPCTGILELSSEDVREAARHGRVTRLIGTLTRKHGSVNITVAPEELDKNDPLRAVSGTGKGITYSTRHMGDLTIIGGSSGRCNIAATLLKDIINVIMV